jgi:hypothetical protein
MPSNQPPPFDSVESAVADIAAGRMVSVADGGRREDEGDRLMGASKARPESLGVIIRGGTIHGEPVTGGAEFAAAAASTAALGRSLSR